MASPELQEVIQQFKAQMDAGYSEDQQLDLETMRRLAGQPRFPAPDYARFKAADANGVRCQWVLAPNSDPGRRLLYLHGGGYVLGTIESYADLTARIAAATGCSVLNADYRLAPENPFPAAVEDGLAALRWLRANGPDGPAPATSTFVAGDSSGGGLTLAVLLAARDAGDPLPDAGITLSAWANLAINNTSRTELADLDPVLGGRDSSGAALAYLGTTEATNPLASPVYADYHGMPPLLMQAGSHEVIVDDTTQIAAKAKASGVDVTLEVWPEMIHVWQLFAPVLPEGREAIEHIGAYVRQRSLVTT